MALLQVPDPPLDPALVRRLSRPAQAGHDEHRSREVEKIALEVLGIAEALDDHRLGVVEEPLPGRAAKEENSTEQRSPEGLDPQIEHELGVSVARVRECHEKHPERPRPARHLQGADLAPIDLRLLARQPLTDQVRVGVWARPHRRHVATHDLHPALESPLPDHVKQSRRSQPRVLVERPQDEGLVLVELATPRGALLGRTVLRVEHPLDDIVVHMELARDRAG